MIINQFRVAWRNLLKSKGYGLINIGGLAVGMAVAMLIGLWIWDELSYNKYHNNYDRIVRVMQNQSYNGSVSSQFSQPAVLGKQIRDKYGSDFTHVLHSSWTNSHTLTVGEKKLLKEGNYFEPGIAEMLSLRMIYGKQQGLDDPYSIMISKSVAEAFFGKQDPVNMVIRVDDKVDVKVTGVYDDIPFDSDFRDLSVILPWKLYLIREPWIEKMKDPWSSNFTQLYAQVADNRDINKVSERIKNVKFDVVAAEDRKLKPEIFLHPMSKWHLYQEFENGKNIGGRVQYVWLFGAIGLFVLLLACINFMNLSTARSEKRAKEVGVRKAIGSARWQLVTQFFGESFIVVILAYLIALGLVFVSLPYFNQVADKKMSILWHHPAFWILGIIFIVFTGLVAGSYPALYLSSFQPVKVLKGTFKVGRNAALPRKVLVVLQFVVSVVLIIGTIVVYRQIEYARNRPLGYDKSALIITNSNDVVHKKFEILRDELKRNNLVVDITESTSPTTDVYNTNGGISWEGKDPNQSVDFPNSGVTHEFGKVIGWKVVQGRDFSRDFATDSSAFILNESAVKFIGLKEPVGKILTWNDKPYTIIGVVSDMLVQSPYKPVRAMLYHISKDQESVMIMKANPKLAGGEAISKISAQFSRIDPATVRSFRFVDEDFDRKFEDEERIGKLAAVFAALAIFISCLGLFGLASFTAEQRTKEIGVRKVIGASVIDLWALLSRDFVMLVCISCAIAIPLAWYGMNQWLQKYDYRTDIAWWVFGIAILGSLVITLATVSYQAIKAAMMNPVKSLRTE